LPKPAKTYQKHPPPVNMPGISPGIVIALLQLTKSFYVKIFPR
jgi:hypothetical protein